MKTKMIKVDEETHKKIKVQAYNRDGNMNMMEYMKWLADADFSSFDVYVNVYSEHLQKRLDEGKYSGDEKIRVQAAIDVVLGLKSLHIDHERDEFPDDEYYKGWEHIKDWE